MLDKLLTPVVTTLLCTLTCTICAFVWKTYEKVVFLDKKLLQSQNEIRQEIQDDLNNLEDQMTTTQNDLDKRIQTISNRVDLLLTKENDFKQCPTIRAITLEFEHIKDYLIQLDAKFEAKN